MSKSCTISAEEFESTLVSLALEKLDLKNLNLTSLDLENLDLSIGFTVTGGSITVVPTSQSRPSPAFKVSSAVKKKAKKRNTEV